MARGKASRKKAGQAGGEATKAKHGPSFYQEIGAKGGASRRKNSRSTNNHAENSMNSEGQNANSNNSQ